MDRPQLSRKIKSLPLMREVARRSRDGGRETAVYRISPPVTFGDSPINEGALNGALLGKINRKLR